MSHTAWLVSKNICDLKMKFFPSAQAVMLKKHPRSLKIITEGYENETRSKPHDKNKKAKTTLYSGRLYWLFARFFWCLYGALSVSSHPARWTLSETVECAER